MRKALRWLLPVLVIAAAGATVWLALLDGADLPTLNYDGDAVTYQGPLVFEQREVAFKLVNDSLQYAEFAYGVITDDSITLEDDIAWAKTHLDGHPPWLMFWMEIGLVAPGADKEATITLPEGRLDLVVWNAESSRPRTYVAAIITVAGEG